MKRAQESTGTVVLLRRRSRWERLLILPGFWWNSFKFGCGNPNFNMAIKFAFSSCRLLMKNYYINSNNK